MTLQSLHKKLILSTFFALAMAYMESAIVVYLREFYYPGGGFFPLKNIPVHILLTETGREAATIVILFIFAKILANNGRETFAYFSFNFAIWDICYYIWLKILLDWPASLVDWDILFLIPIPWVGPVLAPVIVSTVLILSAYLILRLEVWEKPLILTKTDWLLEILSGMIIISSFLTPMDQMTAKIYPGTYSWWLFFCGLFLGLFVFGRRVLAVFKNN
jgi:hypothetical protein